MLASHATDKLGVVIEFFDGWYDGPLPGVASYDGQARWFEVAEDFDLDATKRALFLYPSSADELATEREAAGVCLQTTVFCCVCAGVTVSIGVAPSLSATR
jgi:hypothetical protein